MNWMKYEKTNTIEWEWLVQISWMKTIFSNELNENDFFKCVD
jgi:hypothetical protein